MNESSKEPFQFRLGCLFWLTGVVALVVGAFRMTFMYEYELNENTIVHGWPVPVIVFQRSGPTDDWADFVGPTIILAYPLNLAFYAFGPSVVIFLIYIFRRIWSYRRSTVPPSTQT